MKRCVVKGVEFYSPKLVRDNTYYEELFKESDFNIKDIFSHMGRQRRFVATEGDTVINMGVKCVNTLCSYYEIDKKEVGLIVFVTDTPEYTAPLHSVILKEKVGLVNANIFYDMNANCTGMITALDQVITYIQTKNIKYGLVVGAVTMSKWADKKDPITSATWGDGSGCILLENIEVEDSCEIGLVDSEYFAETEYYDCGFLPAHGFSKLAEDYVEHEDKVMKLDLKKFKYPQLVDRWEMVIKNLLKKNNLKPNDISHFVISQFNHTAIKELMYRLDIEDSENKYEFVADKIGYTGTTSPIAALTKAFKSNKIKSGDKVIFISLSGGFYISSLLYQF